MNHHIALQDGRPTGVGRGPHSARLDARRRGNAYDATRPATQAEADTARALLSQQPSDMTRAEEALVDGLNLDDAPSPGFEFPYSDVVAAKAVTYGTRPETRAFAFADGSAICVLEPWGTARMYLRTGCP